jgi:hypothetical protein
MMGKVCCMTDWQVDRKTPVHAVAAKIVHFFRMK